MSVLYLVLADRNLVPLPGVDPIYDIKSARLVTSEMDQFSTHSLTLGGDLRRDLYAMVPFTTVKVYEQGIGLMAVGIIHDPVQQMDDNGDTITLTLHNITDQLAQYSTGLGATYQASLATIVSSLGATVPTGETVTVYDTRNGTVIGYVQYAGTTLACYNQAGLLAATFPGTGTNLPLMNSLGTAVKGYVTVTTTGFTISQNTNVTNDLLGDTGDVTTDGAGSVAGIFAPTNEVTGWSAVALDDGANVASAAPVAWVAAYTNTTLTGNSVRKNAGTTNAYDGAAISAQQVLALPLGARSDASLSWQAPNTGGNYVMGLATPGGVTQFYVGFGFFVQQFTVLKDPLGNPLGTWNIWEAGSLATTGTYGSGTTFQVSIDYTTGVPVAKYLVNSVLVYTSVAAVALPLQPLFVGALPNSEADNAILTTTVRPSQQWWSARWEQATPLEALLDLAKNTFRHLRQGIVASGPDVGGPARTLEYGTFATDSGLRLVSANGGDPNAIVANPAVRLVESLTYTAESSKVINTITPLGASSGDTQVTIERCWRIIGDTSYPNYGKFGNVAGTVFPEYDPVNYPIKRRTTRDGRWEYYVRAVASYVALGNMEVRGKYTDQQFQYVDSTAANQELTARALYVATIAKLKWESQIHQTLSVITTGAFRPPRAGTKVAVDFRKIGQDARGNFSIMNTQQQSALAAPYVMKVERLYDESGKVQDQWTLSNLGFQPGDTNAQDGAASLKQLEAITVMTKNTFTYFSVSRGGDVDANQSADHSLIVPIPLPVEASRIKRVSIRVDFVPFRQQVQTAANQTQTFSINVGSVAIPVPVDTNTIGGAPLHYHRISIANQGFDMSIASTPFTGQPNRYMTIGGDGTDNMTLLSNGHSGTIRTTGQEVFQVDLSPTTHIHTANIPAQTVIATLPAHTHPITAALNDVSSPALATLAIDSGDGNFVDRSAALLDANSNLVGPWTSSFLIYDASAFINAVGKTPRVKVASLATSGNPTGLGHVEVLVYGVMEIGGLSNQVFRN